MYTYSILTVYRQTGSLQNASLDQNNRGWTAIFTGYSYISNWSPNDAPSANADSWRRLTSTGLQTTHLLTGPRERTLVPSAKTRDAGQGLKDSSTAVETQVLSGGRGRTTGRLMSATTAASRGSHLQCTRGRRSTWAAAPGCGQGRDTLHDNTTTTAVEQSQNIRC